MAAEVELKLTLDRRVASRAAELVGHPAVAAVRRGRVRTARVASTYYDTADFALEQARVALRLRRDGARVVQTVKGPPLDAAAGALHAHDEHEWRLARARLDPARLSATPWHKLFARAQRHGGFAPVFATDVVRHSVPLAFPDGSTATLAIDVGSIRAQPPSRRRLPLAEIEIEVGQGTAATAYDLALALVDDWPLTVATSSKAARGYALVHGTPDGAAAPVHAAPVSFVDDGPAEEALRAIARECVRQIAANADGLLADDDTEWVHQMRIGTRRLRSCLSLVATIAGRARVAPLADEVRWLAASLGTARDWDVLVVETMPPLAAALAHGPAAAPGLQRLGRAVRARQQAARAAARQAVRSRRFQRLLLATGALCARPVPARAGSESETARAFAERLLARRHARLLERGAVLAHATPEERHAVRVAAKKLRYVAEFFAPPRAGKRYRRYVKALTRLQDALGHWHDAVSAARLAALLASRADDATVGAVGGWVAAQVVALEPEIDDAWQRFVAVECFWTR
ncbi:MAG TPA: CYTH and CHAD domain-containing protein [Casimicrobiaceae bacterium]|nr:CYTH and CHAD domain-containing protein [Casimicrobiaceae bacterium]